MLLRKIIFGILAVYLLFAAWWVAKAGMVRRHGLLNVAIDPTRDLWHELNDAFIFDYQQKTGETIRIRQSHGGSSSQARSIIDGLDGDVATLALWSDTNAIRKAGLINDGWENRFPNRSLPFVSTIVFVVRQGNPKNIRDWGDLNRLDVQVITPSPKTSGNGKWSFLALWGAMTTQGRSEQDAEEYVKKVYSRVPVLDAGARGATLTFAQKKLGDVHLTWENEAYYEVQESKGSLEIVYPSTSILAEPHVAIVDSVVKSKGTQEQAEAYINFLYSEPAQTIIAKHYLRPTQPGIKSPLPKLKLFKVQELAANWDDLQKRFFAEGAMFDKILAAGRTP